jgi:hypothetical protein
LDTDMGEFEYQMHRFYTGDVGRVGAYASINGQVHIPKENDDDIINDNDNEPVGYFGMIDTTQFLSSSSSSSLVVLDQSSNEQEQEWLHPPGGRGYLSTKSSSSY